MTFGSIRTARNTQLALPSIDVPYPMFPVDDTAEHGEIFTRVWVVELILDLIGYKATEPLYDRSIVEPACGSGSFLLPLARRLSQSCRRSGISLVKAAGAIRAFDLLERNVTLARQAVSELLFAEGWSKEEIEIVVSVWINQADFLLSRHDEESVDYVVGNPPYVRPEDIGVERNKAYRSALSTMTGRSDLYVGFIEKGLGLLKPGGKLGYICADRWMRNQYGATLRELIASHYAIERVISMHDVDAFASQVSAYPAVMVVANSDQAAVTVVDTTAAFGEKEASELIRFAADSSLASESKPSYSAATLPHWFGGRESWPQGSPARLRMIEHLNDNFPALQDASTGTRVGIGVATGADKVFIVPGPVDVEDERLLPLAKTRDLTSGEFKWGGNFLVNPWNEHGLVDLAKYPRLSSYFEKNGLSLKNRFVAKASPHAWYRTIDRVETGLINQPKLLIQDMRMSINPVLDVGNAYPHHNLYFVTSKKWNMRALGGLLLSDVSNAFVEAYAVKMRGGTLRFQAQYLRRIRVPHLSDVSQDDLDALGLAFDNRDRHAATEVALRLYGLQDLGL